MKVTQSYRNRTANTKSAWYLTMEEEALTYRFRTDTRRPYLQMFSSRTMDGLRCKSVLSKGPGIMIFIYSLVTIRRNVTIGMVTMRWDETFEDVGEEEVAERDLNK
jgi:hypothetical protein